MGDVVNAVTNVVKEVSKGAENIVRETGKGVSTVGQVTSNIGNLVGGDVGKGINAITNPLGSHVQATGDFIKGDIKGALARGVGGHLAATTATMNASSTIKEIAKHDTVNTVTLGMSNDMAEVNDSSNRMIRSGEIKDNDVSALTRAGIRAVAIGTGAQAIESAGGLKGIGSTALNAGKSGAGFLKEAGAVAGGAAAFIKNPGSATASYLGIDTTELDGTIDQINDIRDNIDAVRSIIPQPAIERAPSAVGPSYQSPSIVRVGSTSDLMSFLPVVGVVGAGIVALILILKRK